MQNYVVSGVPRWARGAGILLALAMTACAKKAPPRPGRAPVSVTIAPVRRASVPYDITAIGGVTPLQTASVVSQVDGIITDVMFSEGQDVAKGALLFRIDARPYQAAYDQAVAVLARDRATAAYDEKEAVRYDTLAAQRSVTREQDDQARATSAAAAATVDADQGALATAKFNLDNTTIKAPISGRTGSLLVHIGNVVHAAGGTPLVVINQVRPTLVRFSVPGSILPMILRYGAHGGLPVTAMPSDAPNIAGASDSSGHPASPETPAQAPVPLSGGSVGDAHGTLSFIDNAVDTTTATLLLKATFPNTDGTLWAGQIVSATLRLFVEDSVLVVPTVAVVTGQTGTYVWVVDTSNAAEERPVVVERAAGDISVISSGVEDGERVVTVGQSRLSPGAPVSYGAAADSAGGGGSRRGGGRGRGRNGGRGGARSGGTPPAP
ncbi:MAG TPA: efflux RND transporter periplasmic adaptor subunit [Gemmatimonadales bacterium]|jgi:multidrug efflux system membrane fusion protein